MSTLSLAGFAAKMAEIVVVADTEARHALEEAAQIVEKEAKNSLGVYQGQSGPFVAWAELSDFTKDDRVKQGYSENEPELRDGTMRDSIEHTVTVSGFKTEAEIGSNNEVLRYQELGTQNMPPRSILGGALFRKADEVVKVIGESVYGALTGEQVHKGAIPVIDR
jgi:HK97 gp10 family phage protein